MKYFSIKNLISDKISGEWGADPTSDKRVRIIRTTNFTNRGEINFANIVEREIADSKVNRKKLKNGDIIIEKSGGSPTQPVGRVVFFEVNDGHTYLCNNFTSILRPSEKVSPKYLFYSLFFLHQKNKTLNYQNKTTGIINLQLDRYLETEEIPLPSLEDQKRIVKILDAADALRQKRKQAITLLDDYLKSVFLEMFGDPIKNPKSWNVSNLQDLASKIGSGSTPKGGKTAYPSGGISLIRSLNVHDNEFLYENLAFLNEKQAKDLSNVAVQKNDVLLNITGASVCRCTIVPNNVLPARVNQHVSIIRIKEQLQPIYLLHLLISESYKRKILSDARSGGATREALTKQQLEKFKVTCPPLEMQNRFAEIVEKTEFIKQKMLIQSQELETQFQALMQKAFKGEL